MNRFRQVSQKCQPRENQHHRADEKKQAKPTERTGRGKSSHEQKNIGPLEKIPSRAEKSAATGPSYWILIVTEDLPVGVAVLS